MNYGSWITHEGEVIEVEDFCGHTRHCPYNDAHNYGWIATVDTIGDSRYFYCVRFNPSRTTKAAYRALISRIRKVDWEQFSVSGLYLGNFVGYTNDQMTFTKFEFISFIKRLMSGEEKASDGKDYWYEDEENFDPNDPNRDYDGVDYYE